MVKGQISEHGDHQTLTIELPPSVRLGISEVLFENDFQNDRLVLTQLLPAKKADWETLFRAFDEAEIPDDFLQDRDMSPPQERQGW